MDLSDVAKVVGRARKLRDSGRRDEAKEILTDALATVIGEGDRFLACYITHDLGHAEVDVHAQLRWHLEALAHADSVGDDRVRGFYASLHLNLAQTYHVLGDHARATAHLSLAEPALAEAQQGTYRDGLEASLTRLRDVLVG